MHLRPRPDPAPDRDHVRGVPDRDRDCVLVVPERNPGSAPVCDPDRGCLCGVDDFDCDRDRAAPEVAAAAVSDTAAAGGAASLEAADARSFFDDAGFMTSTVSFLCTS